MKILVLGGTRFFGIHLVNALLTNGHDVTIATRGITPDSFGNQVKRIIVNHSNADEMKQTFSNYTFDVVYDDIVYASWDLKNVLDAISCKRFIVVSSTAVYTLHPNTIEEDYISPTHDGTWFKREELDYSEGKRSVCSALFSYYKEQNAVAVRFPYVIGIDDYTKRLLFYVEHTIKKQPMYIDNYEFQMSFINSMEAGSFLAFLATNNYIGAINGANASTISIKEILAYVSDKTGYTPILSKNGDIAPYNGTPEYSINTAKANQLGFTFTDIHAWIYDLLDKMIETF